jgi:hypothetical protein
MNATIKNAIATALRLIEKYGARVAWTQYIPGAVNVTYPEEPVAAVAKNYLASIVFTKDKRVGYEFLKFLDKTEVIGNDQSFLLAGACGFTPAKNDTFVHGGKSYTIETMTPVRPDGNVVLWIGKAKA